METIEMDGFVKSRRPAGVYCMKRHIHPGQKISLDELYEQYGVSHDIPSGAAFVKWLRTVKLRRRDIWEIIYNGVSIVSGDEPFETLNKTEELLKIEKAEEEVVPEKAEETSGKIRLEGEIKVDTSNEKAFSFPSEKEHVVKKDTSERNKRLFNQTQSHKTIKSPEAVKAVRSRALGSDKPKITPRDILDLKVTDLDKIDKIEDLKILKITLNAAENMRNKATLCKRLKKRIIRLKPRSRFGSI